MTVTSKSCPNCGQMMVLTRDVCGRCGYSFSQPSFASASLEQGVSPKLIRTSLLLFCCCCSLYILNTFFMWYGQYQASEKVQQIERQMHPNRERESESGSSGTNLP